MVPNVILVPHFIKPDSSNGISYDLLKNPEKLASVILASDFGIYLANQKHFQENCPFLKDTFGTDIKTPLPIASQTVDQSVYAFQAMIERIVVQQNPNGLTAYELEARLAANRQKTQLENTEWNSFLFEAYNADYGKEVDLLPAMGYGFLHFDGYHYFVEALPASNPDTNGSSKGSLEFWRNVLFSMDTIPLQTCVSSLAFKNYEQRVHVANMR